MRISMRRTAAMVAFSLVAGALATTPASAWWRGGVWIGVPPIVVGPAYYPPYYPPAYYPPGYYYPPPGYYAPPAQTAPSGQKQAQGPVVYGSMCYAGVYSCPAAAKSPVGGVCSCPGLGAPSYGTVN